MPEIKGNHEGRNQEIEEAVLRAFADVPYPGDEAITLPPADYRTERYNEGFKGVHFRDVPLALIKNVRSMSGYSSSAQRRGGFTCQRISAWNSRQTSFRMQNPALSRCSKP